MVAEATRSHDSSVRTTVSRFQSYSSDFSEPLYAPILERVRRAAIRQPPTFVDRADVDCSGARAFLHSLPRIVVSSDEVGEMIQAVVP